jgi:hypothetical protein
MNDYHVLTNNCYDFAHRFLTDICENYDGKAKEKEKKELYKPLKKAGEIVGKGALIGVGAAFFGPIGALAGWGIGKLLG